MRFLIATGIYPPEIGGPAYYAKNLTEALQKKGHTVEVCTFGTLKKLPAGIRHLAFFVKILPAVFRAEKIIALDTFSAAIPTYVACALVRKKLIVRTGGDFIWEQYVERTGDLLPLPLFYEMHKPFSRRERLYHILTVYLVRHARIVFSSKFQKDIWVKHYGISEDAPVLQNASGEILEPNPPEKKNFIMYGRDLKLRNLKNLALAFQSAKKKVGDISLETGQLPQQELLEKIRHSYAVILPSVTDVTPNFILDAIRMGKPFILTKYSEYAALYKDFGFVVDPLNPDDIAEKIVMLSDETTYKTLQDRILRTAPTRSYAELADDFVKL